MNFIIDELPRGITEEIAREHTLMLTAGSYKWYTPFKLRREQIEYKDRFENYLKVFWNDKNTTAPPVQQDVEAKEKTSIYKRRDDDFLAWMESENPPLDKMTKTQIHARLITRNGTLWRSGFSSWWDYQCIFKSTKGRKPNVHRKTSTL